VVLKAVIGKHEEGAFDPLVKLVERTAPSTPIHALVEFGFRQRHALGIRDVSVDNFHADLSAPEDDECHLGEELIDTQPQAEPAVALVVGHAPDEDLGEFDQLVRVPVDLAPGAGPWRWTGPRSGSEAWDAQR